MKHLCTGSKGFLGSHLMRALGEDAVGVDLPEFDVCQRESFMRGQYYGHETFWNTVSCVWHLAALNDATQTFYDRPWDVLNTQIRGTLNVIDACVANGVKTLVLFSSSEVVATPPIIPTPENVPFSIPDPHNPRFSYAAGKQAAEMLAWYSAIPQVVILRPFNVYGPGQRKGHAIVDLIDRIDHAETGAKVPVFGHPKDTRAFCHVDDFIAGARRAVAAQHPDQCREVYNVGNERETSLHELVQRLSHSMGRTDLRFDFQAAPAGSVARRCPDTSKLRGLGWAPATTLSAGLASTIAWNREQRK